MEASALRRTAATAWQANLTGSAAMVAYSAIMALVPLTLLGLFVASLLLGSGGVQGTLLSDLERLFPTAARSTLTSSLDSIRGATAELGAGAAISGVWVGISLWGALDTAFCRIYRAPCRGWIEQKRFGARMLVLGLGFVLALVAVPALQAVALAGARHLPLGLGAARGAGLAVSLTAGHAALFGALCAVYRLVPNAPVPWRGVWPGALGATVALAAASYVFPIYLGSVSTLAHAGAALAFVVVTLVWFYVFALILLAGAAFNAVRCGMERVPGGPGRASA